MKLAPPLSTGETPPPDDVEALLRAYFRAEMPDPWPAPPRVRPMTPPRPAAAAIAGSARSRLALAASVALLVVGSLAVSSGRMPGEDRNSPLSRMRPGEATRVRITETLIQPREKPTEWRIQVTEDPPPGK